MINPYLSRLIRQATMYTCMYGRLATVIRCDKYWGVWGKSTYEKEELTLGDIHITDYYTWGNTPSNLLLSIRPGI
ncbi:uncharacterized protein An16g07550 [Aspergillus niger]|uniref:Contig An16c0230, genomic contig n=2 Tax=Aspergillus niger TaxID=5061 RepID=A2R8L3_ASPNC|nr:uncharacterized protein An16g07550 [Aspergillus niger]CAL00528.1 unnamed protein product [Aspergillus niger]